jgi:hypothetical protein
MKLLKNNSLLKIILVMLSSGIPGFLCSQPIGYGSGPQYLFRDFSMSEVKMKNGTVQTTLLNYNIVSGRMVFVKEDKYLDLTNYQVVDTVYINDRLFVPVGKVYYEVLISGPVSLFVQHIGKLQGKPSAYGRTTDASSNYYLSSISSAEGMINLPLPPEALVEERTDYWISKNDEWFSFDNEKQFLKIFPEESVQLKAFIKENRLNMTRSEDLKKVVSYCNRLIIPQ